MKKVQIILSLVIVLVFTLLFFNSKSTNNKWQDSRYQQEIPLFLTPSDTQALQSLSKDSSLTTELSKVIELLSKKPLEQLANKNQQISCAVVGNAPNLFNSGYGPIIDQHNYVFRMNNAPVEGYQQDVGTRTTFHYIHSWMPEIRNYGSETTTILSIFAFYINPIEAQANLKLLIKKLNEPTANHELVKDSRMPKNILDFQNSILIIHPDYHEYVLSNWFIPEKGNFYRSRELVMPSTGFSTTILAMHLCDSIDLFGFGKPDSQGIWQHYFSKQSKPVPEKHKAEFQWKFIQDLKDKKIVKIYPGV